MREGTPIFGARALHPFDRRNCGSAPIGSDGDGRGGLHIDRRERRGGPGVEQPDFAIGKLRLDDGSPEQHPVLKLADRRAGIREQGGDRRECLIDRQRRLGVAINPVIAMHRVDRQEAHNEPAGEPDDHLRPDQESKPAMDLARPDMKAQPRAQNQVLTPATKLNPPVSPPRARV